MSGIKATELIKILETLPSNAEVKAYEGEITGLLVEVGGEQVGHIAHDSVGKNKELNKFVEVE